jgi:hypothetical protein
MSDDLVNQLWESDEASALTNRAARRIEELEAALPVVKALVWQTGGDNRGIAAVTVVGQYAAFDEGNPRWAIHTRGRSGYSYYYVDTFEAAKVAAQADYEARILSALDLPAQEEARAEAAEARIEELEAMLAKAVEALRYYAVEAMPWDADDSLIARTTLAELKGETNE